MTCFNLHDLNHYGCSLPLPKLSDASSYKISESVFFCFQNGYNTVCCKWSQPPAVAEPPSVPQAPSSFASLSPVPRSDDKEGRVRRGGGRGGGGSRRGGRGEGEKEEGEERIDREGRGKLTVSFYIALLNPRTTI